MEVCMSVLSGSTGEAVNGSGEAKAVPALSATTQMIAKMAFGLMVASSPMQSGATR
jgi:hypothetical protein